MSINDDVAHNIRNERRGEIDRNPSIDCHKCGESHNYQDYWEERYVKGKDWNPAKVAWLCDKCINKAYSEYQLIRRGREHKQLTEFANES
jgi:predicted nucleic-acid-binding Zn-ribbon protein